ncbi:MAG TPA: pentapeptide repeat-containing protein [Solirubrobacterales bacterium]|nr:pentapeptide repeat-containing protein [Solirubrobacterales bacterium]
MRHHVGKGLVALLIVTLLGALLASAPTSALDSRHTETSAGIHQLKVRHLQAEIQALEDQHDMPWWERDASLGILGAIVALGGLLWTITQQRREMSRQRQSDRDAGLFDQQVRLDGLFASLANDIASPVVAVRLSATAGIKSFSTEERGTYHSQLLSLLQGSIKLPREDVSDRVISRAFIEFLATLQERGSALHEPLDLEGAWLEGCLLSGLDLRKADLRGATLREVSVEHSVDLEGIQGERLDAKQLIAPRAQLRSAKLENADLTGAKLKGASLQNAALRNATLVAADLREAQLTAARLRDSYLQSAHFEKADLRGARFDGADLRDAYFAGASIDMPAFKSILRTSSWESAHWDSQQLDRLRSF